MYVEKNLDALMRRTAQRPLPSGRLQVGEAFLFASAISAAGILYLFAFVNPLSSVLSMTGLASYLFLYTPLKTRTWLCTAVGAAPGALPALVGWSAANGNLSPGAWVLFAIVFFWQLPHFYAIGWIYRDDYERAGFPMLSVIDASGRRSSRQASLYIVALIAVTLLPAFMGMAGTAYLVGALILGFTFLAYGILFSRFRNRVAARKLFVASVCYLPVLLALMVVDKLGP
jgi:heme o synthase